MGQGQEKVYYFYSALGKPESVSIAPIFKDGTIVGVSFEISDFADSDLSGVSDAVNVEGEDELVYYLDGDEDGYGDLSDSRDSGGDGYILQGGDCDDSNSDINPGESEINGNDVDENCDGLINLDSCRNLNQENMVYVLQNDVSTTGTCFVIGASNVTLDLNGFNVSGDGGGIDYGVYVNGYNWTTVMNGEIDGFLGSGIYLQNNQNNFITNMGTSFNDIGIYLISSSNNKLSFIIANFNGGRLWGTGILVSDSENNIFTNIITNSNEYYGFFIQHNSNSSILDSTANLNGRRGIYLTGALNALVSNNTANSNKYGIYLIQSSNNTLVDNRVNLNNQDGIYFSNSEDNNLTNNNVCNNNQYAGSHYDISCVLVSSNYDNMDNIFNTDNGCDSWLGVSSESCF